MVALAGCGGSEEAPDREVETATARQGLTLVKVPKALAAGAYHSLFLNRNGEVWAWGQNVFGQLGTGGTSANQPQPTRVNGLPPIKSVAAGIAHSLALDMTGNVWVWGQNGNGQAGLGSIGGTLLVPTRVGTLSGIQSISANGNFSLALGTDGRLWAWGQNTSGQIGIGLISAAEPIPSEVLGLPAVRAMAAGVNHALALDEDGKVWGWGLNTSGQVGLGTISPTVLNPTQVAGVPQGTALAAGAAHSLLVDEQFGNVWAWGQNAFGQVGTGSISSTPVTAPHPVDGVFAVTALVAGHNSSFAIIGNGLAKAWGHNASGQLGNGTVVTSASPVSVTGVVDATALAAGAQHALALRSGCPVWAWGNNGQGQLGTGSTSTTPATSPASALIINTFYFDGDMDGFGDEYLSEQSCEPSPGFVEELDCDDYSATTHPGAIEACNSVDDNCDGIVDEENPSGGEACTTGRLGVCSAGTTACTSGSVICHQNVVASTEACDLLDNDCDGETDEGNPGGLEQCETGLQGVCGEGVTYCTHGAIACVQKQAAAIETCDGKDNDCNGQSDDGITFQAWHLDQDGDQYGLSSQSVQACARPSGYSPNAGDCDDLQPSLNPGAPEICDGVDNNCNGQVDEGLPALTWYRDEDGDGFGSASQSVQSCRQPAGYVANTSDCNDASSAIRPGAAEVCDGVDNDCDSLVDEGIPKSTWYRDADGDGFGYATHEAQDCRQPIGYVSNASDCNDSNANIQPGATEVCDGLDNDCDAQVDEGVKLNFYRDADSDTYGRGSPLTACTQPVGYAERTGDCNDNNGSINPGALEVCDGLDNDCNGQTDDGLSMQTWYRDADGDTFGTSSSTRSYCSQPSGYVSVAGDCNDSSASANPGAAEICGDDIDNNCDGYADGYCGTWAFTGSMSMARMEHTMTLLPSGKVLIAGGSDYRNPLATAEVYDPATGTWSLTGALSMPRRTATATLLPSGKVLVAGGETSTAEVYAPGTGSWSSTGSMASPRSRHTATLLTSGKVLVVGGSGVSGHLATAELYDPATGAWTPTGSLSAARYAHTATLLPSGKVLVAGGFANGAYVSSAELYDSATGTWTATGNLPSGRYDHTATLLSSGKVLLAGGWVGSPGWPGATTLYDPATGSWTPYLNWHSYSRQSTTATLLPSGKVLLASGATGGNSGTIYDPRTDKWVPTVNLGSAREGHTAVLLPSGKVLVVGGSPKILQVTATAELFTP
ncbi:MULTISPECIES: RCC1 domain-containing protein [unclassified Corallococcus]|uniref:RCC1 domain-containing protein n=1 Tax=unclassified Corallococcus TaxID=2685029 RepID=UPI001F5C9EEC|nr:MULTISPECIES: MopE-related protein [unclassified Corallococcus]WAS89456.1 MopE-related protein [Corallococcus sp. NCRR]